MSVQLDWQIGEDDEEPPEKKRKQWPFSSLVTVVVALAVVTAILVTWQTGRARVQQAEARLVAEVQIRLNSAQSAFADGDGELFFTFFAAQPGWRMAQFRPELNTMWRQELTVTRAEAHEDEVWANVSWVEAGQTRQRLLFFQRVSGVLLHIPQPETYWLGTKTRQSSWGTLRYDERDAAWADVVNDKVTETVAEYCRPACGDQKLPFSLTLSTDTNQTAAPGEVRVPSPRLLALDENGRPAGLFWDTLDGQLVDYLAPADIRFGVPAFYATHYQEIIPAFTALHPDIRVEIVPLPDDEAWPLTDLDGGVLVPTLDMLAAGRIMDLTDYAYSDPHFALADFYDQVWHGIWWQERMWLQPQSAVMPLLYLDRPTYARAGRTEPSLRWTWSEMEADVLAIGAQATDKQQAFLDPTRAIFFSYAYNWEVAHCRPGACRDELTPGAIQATYAWYAEMTHIPGTFAAVESLDQETRAREILTRIAFRDIAIWVDRPVKYESHLVRGQTVVRPFPGSERFDGVTPLYVQGNVILRHSARPRATWQWLSFLSNHDVARQLRQIPARPSVAQASGYWSVLPRPIGDVMRTAFPFARPVVLGDLDLFTWAQLASVRNGERDPAGVAQVSPRLQWFTYR